ncbi:hypothetical protein [Snodgrassella alvi]|uniref:hypothetical protein n=1 Tax=Snodgrassella alvi TaxID=1196083 RepID=UPI000C1E1041|nr:hypothetical protein [Snodgrassella alvi]PIT16504.1 hypothetical protein BGI33_03955 [Snodgrassella alvi]PIT18381.1 hypothetical protein BGI34_05135 [Snodgrassella alvi]
MSKVNLILKTQEKVLRKNSRIFGVAYKWQMVKLYRQGKWRSELVREYDLTPSALCRKKAYV